jgi:hypothetical protein
MKSHIQPDHCSRFVSRRSFASLLIVCLLLMASVIRASSPIDGGTPAALAPGAPVGAYPLSGFENINLYNGNLNFNLPLGQVVGRGSAGWPIYFNLEMIHWMVEIQAVPYNCTPTEICYDYYYYPNEYMWTGTNGPADLYGRQVAATYNPACQGGNDTAQTRLTFRSPDGTEFELVDQVVGGFAQTRFYAGCSPYSQAPFNRGRIFVTTDGSAATFVSDTDITDWYGNFRIIHPSGYLMLRDGTRYRIDNGWISWLRDRNGNKLTFTRSGSTIQKITDSLNREVVYGSATITFKGFGGADRVIRYYRETGEDFILRRDYRSSQGGTGFQTYQQLFPGLNGAYSGTYIPYVVTAIELPDHRFYRFYYSPYGNLARVELPSGGAIEYDVSVSQAGTNIIQRLVERRVYLSSNVGAPVYSRNTYSSTSSSGSTTTQVNNYEGSSTLLNATRHYFYGTNNIASDPFSYTPWDEGKEYQTETLAADGSTVLRRINNIWQQGCGLGIAQNPRIGQSITTLPDSSQVTTQTFGYDCYNNRTDVYEYDFGSGAPGALLRHTNTDFLTSGYDTIAGGITNPDPFTTIHLRSLPTQQQVYGVLAVSQRD